MPVANRNNYKDYFVSQVKKYIDQNYKGKITCDDVARYTGYATSTTKHLFKEHTGQTIFEYLTTVRINYLKHKLLTTNEPFSHLVVKAGYQSLGRTYVLFKEKTGVTPSQFRKMNLQ